MEDLSSTKSEENMTKFHIFMACYVIGSFVAVIIMLFTVYSLQLAEVELKETSTRNKVITERIITNLEQIQQDTKEVTERVDLKWKTY